MKRKEDIKTSEEEQKRKLAFNKASANKTGGGTVDEMPLTSIEEQVQLTFCEEQVTGIAGYDTLDLIAEQGRRTVTRFFLKRYLFTK